MCNLYATFKYFVEEGGSVSLTERPILAYDHLFINILGTLSEPLYIFIYLGLNLGPLYI